MERAIGEAILHGVVPAGVFGVAAAGHRAVVSDVREGVGPPGWIVLQHRVGTERALAPQGKRAVVRRGNPAEKLVVERLAGSRAVAGFGVAASGEAVVDRI